MIYITLFTNMDNHQAWKKVVFMQVNMNNHCLTKNMKNA